MTRSLKMLCLAGALALGACSSGPRYLVNSVDDWRNSNYYDEPLTTAVLTDVLPVYPIIGFFAWIPDYLVLNPVQFWGHDVWSGQGTAFHHTNPNGDPRTPWFKQ